jgi:hypothetical protein
MHVCMYLYILFMFMFTGSSNTMNIYLKRINFYRKRDIRMKFVVACLSAHTIVLNTHAHFLRDVHAHVRYAFSRNKDCHHSRGPHEVQTSNNWIFLCVYKKYRLHRENPRFTSSVGENLSTCLWPSLQKLFNEHGKKIGTVWIFGGPEAVRTLRVSVMSIETS